MHYCQGEGEMEYHDAEAFAIEATGMHDTLHQACAMVAQGWSFGQATHNGLDVPVQEGGILNPNPHHANMTLGGKRNADAMSGHANMTEGMSYPPNKLGRQEGMGAKECMMKSLRERAEGFNHQ